MKAPHLEPGTVHVIQVIESCVTLRGDGQKDPYRNVAQYHNLDGALLAEYDPLIDVLLERGCIVPLGTLSKIRDIALRHPGLEEIEQIADMVHTLIKAKTEGRNHG